MTEAREAIYSYTGHPLVDVGACVIAAYNGRRSLAEITEADLENMRRFIREHYCVNPMRNFLTTVFPNSAYANPNMGMDKRESELADILGDVTLDCRQTGAACVYCRRTGTRRYRQHIPLVSGEGVFNFTPEGQAGLPVCSYCLLAIQASVLGTRKCGEKGKMLLPHSDSEHLTMELVQRFLRHNREIISMAGSDDKYPNQSAPRTVLMAALADLQEDAEVIARADSTPALTAYHLTNYGTSADVQILRLPSEVVAFVREVQRPEYRTTWNYMVNRGWFMGLRRKKDGRVDKPDAYKVGEHTNRLYEDLFDLPDQAVSFVRRHLNWRVRLFRDKEAMQADVPDAWDITELFLRKVMLMERQRVETLQTLGERWAQYVKERNDRRFFQRIYGSWRTDRSAYGAYRSSLLRASQEEIRRGRAPLISFDEFLMAFEEGEEFARADWGLARDLILLKMMDTLHELGWLQEHADALEPPAEEDAEQAPAEQT